MSNRKIWDFWSKYYKKLWVQKVSLKPTRDVIVNCVSNRANARSLLDLGCGIGELIGDIKDNVDIQDLVGLDYSKKMIEVAQKSEAGVQWICEDIDSFDVGPFLEKYDIITCTHSFPYYKDQKAILEKMHKMLKKHGRAYVGFASSNSIYDCLCMFFVKLTTGTAKYPSVSNFEAMCQPNFKVVRKERVKVAFFMPSIYVFELEKYND